VVAEGRIGILLVLYFTALFPAESSFTQFNRVWTESRVEDFADGQLDPMMYVSRRTVTEPDSGCIEFFSRFDLDNNGYFDLVSTDDSGPYLRVYFGSASGYSVANSRYYPVPGGGNVDLADLNLDGYAELIHSGWRSGHITIYWGTDSGPSPVDTTWLVISGQSEAVTVYDLDRDAYLDIIAGSDNGMVYIFWGDADGYNSSRRSSIFLNGSVGHNLEVADFDKDGWGDIVASLWSRNQAPVVYWGSGRSPRRIVWLPVSGNNPHGVTVADLNDDSWLDLVFTGYDTVTSAFIYYGSASGFSVSNREIIHPGQCYGGSAAVLWNYDKTLDLVFYRGDWGRNVAYRPRVYFNRPDTTPHFSDARFSEIGELEFNASGGFIADLNYDGFQDIFINNMMPDSASFVLWGPYYNSATALPVDRDHHGLWREVGNIYTRGFYARYLSSIYEVGEDSVITGGNCSWVANEPPGSSVGIEVRAGNTPVPDETWTEFTPVLVNGGSLPQTVNGFRYLQYRAFFSYSRPCYLPHLEQVSFNITLRPRIDAAVRAILAPVGVVDSGSVIVPRAVIENLHSGTSVATVTLKVGDDYLATQIDTLGPFALDTVSFAVWAANVLGVHIVRCSVYVAEDENRANDTLSTTVEVVAGSDVGPVAIVLPPVRAESGSVYVPAVVVSNFGVRQEIFPVHLFIGGDYHEVVIDTLAPGGSDTVRFPVWVAHPVGQVVVRCSTGLERDIRPANDTLSRVVDVWVGIDASVRAILAPVGVVDSGSVIVPRAVVANHSTGAQLIPVRLWIDGGYSAAETVLVAADDTVLVSFASWVASPVGVLTVRCSTALAGDTFFDNDLAVDTVRVVTHPDGAVTDIYAPIGLVDSGTVVIPWARVCNYGSSPVIVPVLMRIGDNYEEVRTKLLGIGAKDTVFFPSWVAVDVGVHPVVCSTMVSGDENPDNDWRIDSVQVVKFVDVAAVAIIAPEGVVDSGGTVVPQVVIANLGTSPVDVPVRLQIGTGYEFWVRTTVFPNASDTVSFPEWQAMELGEQMVRCSTALKGDQNDANNVVNITVKVVRRIDAACDAILTPRGVVQLGDSVVPSAVIVNNSTSTQAVPVWMFIGADYKDFQSRMLEPGESDTVDFRVWWATGAGFITVKCSTALLGDERSENDVKVESIFVRSYPDAAVNAILAPVGMVDSGRRVLPKALVANYSTALQRIPVEMRIGNFYRSYREQLIAPGRVDTVLFDEWWAVEVGRHVVRCSTSLEADSNPGNDYQDVLIDVCWRDAGCDAILAPVGAVPAGESVIPSVRVRNFGTTRERIPALFRIGARYAVTVWSDTIDPDGSAELTFPPVLIEEGEQVVCCSTALAGDMNLANDKIEIRVFGVTRNIDLAADSGATVLPGGVVNYFLTCFNNGNFVDTVDIISYRTRPGWVVELFDSAGTNSLADNNGNGVPDLGAVPAGGVVGFVVRVTVPFNETGLIVDSTEVEAISASNPMVRDRVRLLTAVAPVVNLVIHPDQFHTVVPGQANNFVFTISNFGNIPDYADLSYQVTQGGWQHRLLDGSGAALEDRNNNGRPDIGPIAPYGGSTELIFEVTPSWSALLGQRDSARVSIWSFADNQVSDEAVAIAEVGGMVTRIDVTPDRTDVLAPGETRDYEFTVVTAGTIRTIVNLAVVAQNGSWEWELLDGESETGLRDSDFDRRPDLGFVTPDTPVKFKLRVKAPHLTQLLNSPNPSETEFWLWAYAGQDSLLRDSVRVKLTLTPRFQIFLSRSPSDGRVRFIFSIPERGEVSLLVYNRLGERVKTLLDHQRNGMGIYVLDWDGTNESGRKLAPGVYVYRFEVKTELGRVYRTVKKFVMTHRNE